MKKLLLLAVTLASCDLTPLPPAFTPQPRITFPQDDGGIPYFAGGPFLVQLSVTSPNLDAPNARGLLELVAPDSPDGGTKSIVISFQTQDAGTLVGTTQLTWPPGGPIAVRATFGGNISERMAPLDPLLLGILPLGAGAPSGLGISFPVCVESTAAGGTIALTLTNATTTAGASSTNLELTSGGCSSPVVGPARQLTHAQTKIVTTRQAFSLSANLVGTSASAVASGIANPITDVQLEIDAGTTVLPVAGSILAVSVRTLSRGSVLSGVVVTFETEPPTQVLPPSIVTDEGGGGSVSVLVPDASVNLRIDALAGQTRAGITLGP